MRSTDLDPSVDDELQRLAVSLWAFAEDALRREIGEARNVGVVRSCSRTEQSRVTTTHEHHGGDSAGRRTENGACLEQCVGAKGRDGGVRYAVAYIDDPYGRSVAAGAQQAAQQGTDVLAGAFGYQATDDFDALTAQIAARGAAVVGIDASEDMIAAALKRGLDVRVTALEESGLPERSYDVVSAFHVLEHQPDSRSFLATMARWARPGPCGAC